MQQLKCATIPNISQWNFQQARQLPSHGNFQVKLILEDANKATNWNEADNLGVAPV